MKSFHPIFILILGVSIVVTAASEEVTSCCGRGSVFRNENNWLYECENGQKPKLPCNGSNITVLNYGYKSFIYQTEDDGTKMYVDEFYKVHSPYYCIGHETEAKGKENRQIVLYCRDEYTFRHRLVIKNLIFTIGALLFMVSGIFLALTAVIYFFIPQTQGIEGRCTFHLTLNQSLIYLMGSYWCISLNAFEVTLLEEFCISYWYLFMFSVLSFFIWSALLAYDIWRRYRHNSRTDESKLMRRYLIIGYGIPAVLVAIGNITIHTVYYSNGPNSFNINNCYYHQFSMFFLFAALPILITLVVSGFFFVSLQRELWRIQPSNSPANSNTNKMGKFKFRYLLNARLFVLTGLPVLLLIICIFLATWTNGARLFVYLIYVILFFMACEGVVVFYILVISRKRILQGIAGKLGITVTGWQACPESEESIAYSNENGNENDLNVEI